jgi:arginine decarboxylase
MTIELQATVENTSKSLLLTPNPSSIKPKWSIEDSEKLYRIQGWGDPYFSINAAGHVTVSPQGDHGGSLDLYELVESLRKRNIVFLIF